jgi:hypothetical protein
VAVVVAATVYGLSSGGFAAVATPTTGPIGTASPTLAEISPSPSPAPSPTLGPTVAPTPQPTCAPPATDQAGGGVPILYLHKVIAPPAAWLTWTTDQRRKWLAYDVLPSAFAADLDWLQANGYTTILPRDLAAHWDHGAPLPKHPVIITLDDGTHDWVQTVLPMLQQRKMVAEFYVTGSAIAVGTITWAASWT